LSAADRFTPTAVSDRGYNIKLKFRPPAARLAHRVLSGTLLERRARRGGRVVDGSGLENRQGASRRGFESHPLRCAQRVISGESLVTGQLRPSIAECGV